MPRSVRTFNGLESGGAVPARRARGRGGNLDAKTVEAAAPKATTYRMSDGRGLLLEVRPTGAKVWLCRLTVHGRRRDIGLGGFPTVSLSEARDKADAALKLADNGIDPIEAREREAREREAARQAADAERKAAEEARDRTFLAVARECIKAQSPGWKNARTAHLWQHSLDQWAGALADKPIADIDRAAVLDAISQVWTTRPATAKKVLRRIGTVLRYAAARDWRPNDNVADARMLRAAKLLPALPGGRKQPSLPWARLPAFWAALEKVEGLGAAALRLAILTALRSGEIRNARWSWVSFDGVPTLTIPGEVMKGKKSAAVLPHRVPLPPAALEVLARAYSTANGTTATAADLPLLAAAAGDALIFPSATRRTPISDMTLSAVLRRMNGDRPEGMPAPWRDADGREAVPHGMRATFSTWVDDTRPHEREAAEKALAHEVGNAVSGAYRRSDLFDRRIPLMAEWAAHVLSGGTAKGRGTVAKLRRRGTARAA